MIPGLCVLTSSAGTVQKDLCRSGYRDVVTLSGLFTGTVAGTVGLEEELLLVRRGNWLPADVASVVAEIGDPRVKPELPACQLEIATSVHKNAQDAVEELRACRAMVAAGSVPQRRQGRLGERRSPQSKVQKSVPSEGSRTPRASRPA